MARGEDVRAKGERGVEQVGEFQFAIAGDAGNRRLAGRVALREGIDYPCAEALFVIQHVMGNVEPRRDEARVMNVLAGAAAPLR